MADTELGKALVTLIDAGEALVKAAKQLKEALEPPPPPDDKPPG